MGCKAIAALLRTVIFSECWRQFLYRTLAVAGALGPAWMAAVILESRQNPPKLHRHNSIQMTGEL
jgi:hypothetical protein